MLFAPACAKGQGEEIAIGLTAETSRRKHLLRRQNSLEASALKISPTPASLSPEN